MNRLRCLATLPLVGLLLGCPAKVAMASLPMRPVTGKVDKIFTLLAPPPSGSGYLMTQLREALGTSFWERRITTQSWVKNHLDLNERPKLEAEMGRFQPRFVLTVAQISTTHTQGLGFGFNGDLPTGVILDLNLVTADSPEVVWKGRLSSEGSDAVNVRQLSARILEALTTDGILPATPAQ